MSTSLHGILALAGSGEFRPAMAPVDSILLERLGAPRHVAILPTASAPDGPDVPERWARMGMEHFTSLGATVEAVMVLTRADAQRADLAERIASANMIYLSGGKPRYLVETLRDTSCWQAIRGVFTAGGVVAGCSAGAMVLGAEVVDIPRAWRTIPGLGLAPGIAVVPHFDELPRLAGAMFGRLARNITLVGIDGSTALVGREGEWQAMGMGRVTVMRANTRMSYSKGEIVPL